MKYFVGSTVHHPGFWVFPAAWRVRVMTPLLRGGLGGRFVRELSVEESVAAEGRVVGPTMLQNVQTWVAKAKAEAEAKAEAIARATAKARAEAEAVALELAEAEAKAEAEAEAEAEALELAEAEARAEAEAEAEAARESPRSACDSDASVIPESVKLQESQAPRVSMEPKPVPKKRRKRTSKAVDDGV